MSRLQIAHISPRSDLYGMSRSILDTFREIDRSRFTLSLITVAEGPLEEVARELDVEVIRLPWLKDVSYRHPIRWVAAIVRLSAWLRSNRMDAIELNPDPSFDLGLFYLAARWGGAKWIVRIRTFVVWVHPYQKIWLRRADRILPVTEGAFSPFLQKQSLGSWGRKARPDQVKVVPEGRDIHKLKELAADRELVRSLGVPDQARIVGMVATINPNKRPDLFIQAAKYVSQQNQDVWFMIVGGDSGFSSSSTYQEGLEHLVEELGLSERLIFTGYRHDAVQLMKNFDVLVLPSVREGLGGVLIEAMAMGIPVVAAHTGGTPEVVQDGISGILIKEPDAKVYAEAILRLLHDQDYTTRIQESGKVFVERFDSPRATQLLESCYKEICSRNGHSWQQSVCFI